MRFDKNVSLFLIVFLSVILGSGCFVLGANEGGFSNLSADINDDGTVDMVDLARLGLWWSNDQCAILGDCSGADVNGDGSVDSKDVKAINELWLSRLDETRTVTVAAAADAYVRDGIYAGTNYGSAVELKTLNSDSDQMEMLIRFDLPDIAILPDEAYVLVNTSGQVDPVENVAYLAGDGWDENGVTWNNKPSYSDELDAWVTDSNHAYRIDVRDAVSAVLDGGGELSILVRSPHDIGSDGQSVYYSREDAGGLGAELVMRFNLPKAYVSPGESIQSALDSIRLQGGGEVVLEAGDHYLMTSLVMYSNITLRGQGKDNTKILMFAFVDKPLMKGSVFGTTTHDVTIRDLTFDGMMRESQRQLPKSYFDDPPAGAPLRKAAIGILFTLQDSGRTFERIRFENIGVTRCSMGIHVKDVDDLRIFDCDLSGNGHIIAYYHNIYFRRANNTLLKNTLLNNCTAGNGFNLSTNCNNLIIDNCQAINNRFRGIRFEASDGGGRMMIINSQANGNGLLEGQPGIRVANVPDFTILNCTASGNGDYGIYVPGSGTGLIKDNFADYNQNTDYYLSNCYNTEVIDNVGGAYQCSGCSSMTLLGNDFE